MFMIKPSKFENLDRSRAFFLLIFVGQRRAINLNVLILLIQGPEQSGSLVDPTFKDFTS